jgi:cell division protein FtsB
MTKKQNILISISILLLVTLFVYIIFSKHGYSDLALLEQEHGKLLQNNERLMRENLAIGIEIDRLRNDPVYIENIARRELGMIGKDEIILKPNNNLNRKK